ncbi:MAG: hypothetical protein IJT07_02725 [Oscillospiraceae bacterium]|nr:hypothetical protein [Oscillospiraceae bacterium]
MDEFSEARIDDRAELLKKSLELIDTAAVIVDDDGEVQWQNKAAAPLKLSVGYSVESTVSGFERQFAAWDYHRSYRQNVTALGTPWVMTVSRIGPVNLLLFTHETEADSAVRTVLQSLFHGMDSVSTDLTHALRELAPELEEFDDPVLAQKVAAVTRASYRLARSAIAMAELGHLEIKEMRVLPREKHLLTFFERLVDKEKQILFECGTHLDAHLILRDTQYGNLDPLIVEKIVANLLCNAVKYGEKGAPIELHVTCDDQKTVQITVTNKGAGIDGDTLPTAFTRYLQTPDIQNLQTGAGMGLALVRELAQRHGGAVMIRTGGDGAKIIVSLNITMKEVLASHSPLLASAMNYDPSLIELSEVLPADTFLSYAVEI